MSTSNTLDIPEKTTSHSRYDAYKDSGVEWLGEIPVRWQTAKLKYLCDQSAVYGANRSSDEYVNEGVRFLRTTDIDDFGRLSDEGVSISEDSVRDYLLADGDLLLSRSGTVGRSFVYEADQHPRAAYAGYLVRFVLKKHELRPEFAFYFTKTTQFNEWLRSNSIESTIGNVSGDKYANMTLVVPPLPEQRAIAAYLDRETERIDALVAKKERLIELLEEKRTALISHAVTKGLDDNAEMKDSGVEWIGRIQAGWEVVRLKHVADVQGGIAKGKRYGDDEKTIMLPYLRVANVQDGYLNLDEISEIEVTSEDAKRYVLRDGDVLMNEGGDYDNLGRGAVWNGEIQPCLHQNHVFAVRPAEVESEWLAQITRTP